MNNKLKELKMIVPINGIVPPFKLYEELKKSSLGHKINLIKTQTDHMMLLKN